MKKENNLLTIYQNLLVIYRNAPEKDFIKQRFDKQYIIDYSRQALKRRYKTITAWYDLKVYELAFNAINQIYFILPRLRDLEERTGISTKDVAAKFGYVSAQSMMQGYRGAIVCDLWVKSCELILEHQERTKQDKIRVAI